MNSIAGSGFNMFNVTQQMGTAINQMSTQIEQNLANIQQDPNPNPADLAVFQMQLSIWSNLIQLESTVIKVYGDTMNKVIMNMGG